MAAPKKSSGGKGPVRVRMLNGTKLTPVLYDGPFGKYIAAYLNDQLVKNKDGRPIEFKNAGKLEWV